MPTTRMTTPPTKITTWPIQELQMDTNDKATTTTTIMTTTTTTSVMNTITRMTKQPEWQKLQQ